VIFNQVLHKLT